MTVRVLAFARLRELLGFSERAISLPCEPSIDALWNHLVAATPAIAILRGSTRFARNGAIVSDAEALREGDELALLPPVGGG